MGKSYKKTPISKDNNSKKVFQKRMAAKAIRRKKIDEENGVDMATHGNAYKKEYESWFIADYVSRWTKEEAIAEYNKIATSKIENYPGQKESFMKRYPTLESFINFWEKCMIRK